VNFNNILALIFFFVISNPALSAEKQIMRIGVDLTYPPFQYKNQNGHPTGFEIEVTNALCKSVHLSCQYVVNTFDTQIPALLSRKIDVISPLGVTKKREAAIAFSNYVFHIPTVLVGRKEYNLLPNANSLKGKSVAVQQGTIQEAYANKYWLPSGVIVKSYPDSEAVYQDLYAERVSAALCPSVALKFGFLQTPEGKDFEVKGQEVTDADLFSVGSAYGIRKNDRKAQIIINKGLDNIMKDGTYSAIKNKYFGNMSIEVNDNLSRSG